MPCCVPEDLAPEVTTPSGMSFSRWLIPWILPQSLSQSGSFLPVQACAQQTFSLALLAFQRASQPWTWGSAVPVRLVLALIVWSL